MPMTITLRVDGHVESPREFAFEDLATLAPQHGVLDVTQFGLKRGGDAVRLNALLNLVSVKPSAKYISVHSSTDGFHASGPLESIRDTALVVFRVNGGPLESNAGGPFRFFIPQLGPCHSGELDACANVKFVDRIEVCTEKKRDARTKPC
jgi:DMSO/TMAO reductase YedYZ molybdopterin-dependent catalytic subunit